MNRSEAEKAIIRARTELILTDKFAYYASGVLRLKLEESDNIETAGTDGVTLTYNPAYIESLTHAQVMGLVAHEVDHCLHLHQFRRGTRDARLWNIAADLAINPMLVEAGLELPDGALLDSRFPSGSAVEEIYNDICDDSQFQALAANGTFGEVYDASTETGNGTGNTEEEWRITAVEAVKSAAKKMQGNIPGWMRRVLDDASTSKVNWRAELMDFAQTVTKEDSTWRRPSRRYMAHGLYMPSLFSESVGPIVFAVDTSGSVSSEELGAAQAEIQAIVDTVGPERLYVPYCDTEVSSVDEFEQGELITLEPTGGGGTDFRPVFDWVEHKGIEPVCLIYLTDLYGTMPSKTPDYPVLWLSTSQKKKAKWGKTIYVEVQ